MSDNMKQALDHQLSAVEWTAEDERRLRLRMQEEKRPARRKLPAGLVLALVAMLMVTVAIATTQNGLLGLIQRMKYPDLSSDAQEYIQIDNVTLETQDFTITIPEHYYDGRSLRTSVTIIPKEGSKLLYVYGTPTTTPWQKLICMDESNADPSDTRTIQDMVSAFKQVYSVQLLAFCDGEYLKGMDPFVWYTCDYSFDPETCALTFLLQAKFEEMLPQRELTLKTAIYRDGAGIPQKIDHTMMLAAVAEPELYECTEPAVFAEAGVRIDKLTFEVLPQDVYYTINYTILDWKESTYRAGHPAIWFDFCKVLPQKGVPLDLLSSGLHSLHNYRPVEGMQYVQTGTLARSEFSDTYYIVARDMGRKIRYEANAFSVHLVSAE